MNRGLDHRREVKKAHFLKMLSTRRFTYGSVQATETMRQALSAHLAWGAFPTPGYTALRKSLQARVLSVAEAALAEALGSNNALHSLDLSWNLIGDAGASGFLSFLLSNEKENDDIPAPKGARGGG